MKEMFPASPKGADDYIRAHCPPRAKGSHKATHGRVFLACGSPAYTGAAALAAGGALYSGAGMTYLCAPAEVLAPARVRYPELICREGPPITEEPRAYPPLFEGANAILIGPGIGVAANGELAEMLLSLMHTAGPPLVLDADALNSLAAQGALPPGKPARAVIMTPHPMEFARLCGCSVEAVQADRVGHACRFAAEHGITLVLKGAGTVIAAPNGEYAVCPAGSPALAKAGTGDVLAGMLAAFLGQGMPPATAAYIAAYLHGRGGEELAREYGERGVLPSDLAAAAARVLCRILSHT